MQNLWSFAALLILQCWAACSESDTSRDVRSMRSVGIVTLNGTALRVYNIGKFKFAEPRISFGEFCWPVQYNHLYQKYQFSLPVKIESSALERALRKSEETTHLVRRATLTELKALPDPGLVSRDSDVAVMAQLMSQREGELLFLCEKFTRCQQLRDAVASDPLQLSRAVKFAASGTVEGSPVLFGDISAAEPPRLICRPDKWVVFQRRVDGSLSFAQDWDTYVKGFGSRKSNYWMGLEKLSALTLTSKYPDLPSNVLNATSRCRLRIETKDFSGRRYWGEYGMFQVLDAFENYTMKVGGEVHGSQFAGFAFEHNNARFHTRDLVHLNNAILSRLAGFGGWWLHHRQESLMNLNGAYGSKNISSDKLSLGSFCSALIGESSWPVLMKSTVAMFKCG